jgi:hypothetical protein
MFNLKVFVVATAVLSFETPLYLVSSNMDELSLLPCHENTIIYESDNHDYINALNPKYVNIIPTIEIDKSIYDFYTRNCKAIKHTGTLPELENLLVNDYFLIATNKFNSLDKRQVLPAKVIPYSKRSWFQQYTFFNKAVFMGIFTMFLVLLIAYYGIMMIYSLQTPDKFEKK